MQAKISTRQKKNLIFKTLICSFTALAMLPLFMIIGEPVMEGYRMLSIRLFTRTEPTSIEAMTAKSLGESLPGGILNGITGTLLTLAIAVATAIPPGLMVGIFLSNNPESRFASLVRMLSELIQGIPSIVVGIIVYAWIVKPLHQYSALAGGIALAIMMQPLIIRSTEESLNLLPRSLREAGAALGCSQADVALKILLPSAFGGIFTGILLALSRILGETAPLLVTILGTSAVNWDIFMPVSAIPLQIWQFYNDSNLSELVWASALVLLITIFIINISAKNMTKKWRTA